MRAMSESLLVIAIVILSYWLAIIRQHERFQHQLRQLPDTLTQFSTALSNADQPTKSLEKRLKSCLETTTTGLIAVREAQDRILAQADKLERNSKQKTKRIIILVIPAGALAAAVIALLVRS